MEQKKWRYPAQPERYEKSPGMRDYENMLGHYDLNFSDFDAYLAHTQCAVGSGKGGNPPPRIDDLGPDWKPEVRGQKSEVGDQKSEVSGQQAEDVAPAGGAGEGKPAETLGGIDLGAPENIAPDAAGSFLNAEPRTLNPDSLNPEPRTLNTAKKATRRQILERIAAIRLWLQEGVMPAQIAAYAQTLWGIKRRMCQIYLKRVREGWAKQASKVDYLAHLWHSKLQRETLIAKAMPKLDQAADLRGFTGTLRCLTTLLKDRDNVMASVLEHRVATERDESPDGAKAKAHRQRMVVMPWDEFFERLEHMRNTWWYKWNQQRYKEDEERRERQMKEGGWVDAPNAAPWRGYTVI